MPLRRNYATYIFRSHSRDHTLSSVIKIHFKSFWIRTSSILTELLTANPTHTSFLFHPVRKRAMSTDNRIAPLVWEEKRPGLCIEHWTSNRQMFACIRTITVPIIMMLKLNRMEWNSELNWIEKGWFSKWDFKVAFRLTHSHSQPWSNENGIIQTETNRC